MFNWNCICDKQSSTCECEVYVGFSDNYLDFDNDKNVAKDVVAVNQKSITDDCKVKCGAFDTGYNKILINNMLERTGADPSEIRKKKFVATNDFFSDPNFPYYQQNRGPNTRCYDLQGVIGH